MPGATSGTKRFAAVMFGMTSPPGVHGPLQSLGYRVVGLISHTVLRPGGVVTFGSEVGEGTAHVAVEHPNR